MSPNTTFDCATHDELSTLYQQKNVNLTALINGHASKPVQEPYFPGFSNVKSRMKCTDQEKRLSIYDIPERFRVFRTSR